VYYVRIYGVFRFWVTDKVVGLGYFVVYIAGFSVCELNVYCWIDSVRRTAPIEILSVFELTVDMGQTDGQTDGE